MQQMIVAAPCSDLLEHLVQPRRRICIGAQVFPHRRERRTALHAHHNRMDDARSGPPQQHRGIRGGNCYSQELGGVVAGRPAAREQRELPGEPVQRQAQLPGAAKHEGRALGAGSTFVLSAGQLLRVQSKDGRQR